MVIHLVSLEHADLGSHKCGFGPGFAGAGCSQLTRLLFTHLESSCPDIQARIAHFESRVLTACLGVVVFFSFEWNFLVPSVDPTMSRSAQCNPRKHEGCLELFSSFAFFEVHMNENFPVHSKHSELAFHSVSSIRDPRLR